MAKSLNLDVYKEIFDAFRILSSGNKLYLYNSYISLKISGYYLVQTWLFLFLVFASSDKLFVIAFSIIFIPFNNSLLFFKIGFK